MEVFSGEPAIQRALIYGSHATGRATPASDVDCTLIAPGLTVSDLTRILVILDAYELPQLIDLSLWHQLSSPSLREHIQRVGRVIYARDGEN